MLEPGSSAEGDAMRGWLPLTIGLLAVVLGAVWTVQGLGYVERQRDDRTNGLGGRRPGRGRWSDSCVLWFGLRTSPAPAPDRVGRRPRPAAQMTEDKPRIPDGMRGFCRPGRIAWPAGAGQQLNQMGRTCSACGPFWPWAISNSTRWFSSSVR